MLARICLAVLGLGCTPMMLAAQQPPVDCSKVNETSMDHVAMDHAAHMKALEACAAKPTQSGQAAFGAISEVVRLLTADPRTDWTKVNIEALRQHLIDMDDVVMHAAVAQRPIPGGLEITATGSGRTADAIKRMAVNHTRMLDQGAEYHASASELGNGARLTITAKDPSDARAVSRIRGLGFAGLLTEGEHHAAHHMAIARGEAMPH